MIIPSGCITKSKATYIARTGRYNDTGANLANYQMSLNGSSGSNGADFSGGTVKAGDLAVLLHLVSGTSDPTLPTDFAFATTAIARVSVTVGENYRIRIATKILTSTDISNGYIQLGQAITNQFIAVMIIFRYATTVIEESPTNFQRAASLNANSVSIARPTATRPGQALSITCRGGGSRTTTDPSGFTNRADIMSAGSGAGRYSAHVSTKALTANSGQIAAGTSSFSGSADMTVTNLTLVIQ